MTRLLLSRERERDLLSPSRAFTLIEILIVIAMLSVLSTAFFTVFIYAVRGEAEDDLCSTLRQEGLSAVRAIIRDTHLARGSSAGGLVGVLIADIRTDTQTLLLEMDGASREAKRAIAYRLSGSRLERVNWSDTTTTPTIQTLSSHVRAFRILRSGNLIGVEIELAINHYTKDFTAKYRFATRAGGVYGDRVGQVVNLSHKGARL